MKEKKKRFSGKGAAFTSMVLVLLAGLLFVSCEQPTGSPPVNAHQPTITAITGSPTAAAWNVASANTFDLTVTASKTDGGNLTYQWYSVSSAANTGGTVLSGKTAATLSLAKADYGTNGNYYFYAVVTNTITDNGDGGNKTANKTSDAATVTVSGNVTTPPVNAGTPSITTQPAVHTYWNITDNASKSLTITAASPDTSIGGNLSYKWYSKTTPGTTGGTLVSGQTSASLTLNKSAYTTDGVRYFYVEVTNTIPSNAANGGTETATITSNAARVAIIGNKDWKSLEGNWDGGYGDGYRINLTTGMFIYDDDFLGNGGWGMTASGPILEIIAGSEANSAYILFEFVDKPTDYNTGEPPVYDYSAHGFYEIKPDISIGAGAIIENIGDGWVTLARETLEALRTELTSHPVSYYIQVPTTYTKVP